MKIGYALATPWLFGFAMLVAGCGSVNIWPLSDSKPASSPRIPENATQFRCEGGKSFYLRYLDSGKSAWVIYPDRQVRLDKLANDAGGGYSNGIATLKFAGAEASLTDGPGISYRGCKAAVAETTQ